MHKIIKKYSLLYYWKSLVWAGIIAYGLLSSGDKFPKSELLHFAHADKLLHLLIFFGLEWLVLFDGIAVSSSPPRIQQRIVMTVVVIAYAALTEIMQFYISVKRNADIFDFIVDFAGILIALLTFKYTYRLINRFFRLRQ